MIRNIEDIIKKLGLQVETKTGGSISINKISKSDIGKLTELIGIIYKSKDTCNLIINSENPDQNIHVNKTEKSTAKKSRTTVKKSKRISSIEYKIKIITSAEEMEYTDFKSFIDSFFVIVDNFCTLFNIYRKDWNLAIKEVGSGCINFNIGINFVNNNNNLSLASFNATKKSDNKINIAAVRNTEKYNTIYNDDSNLGKEHKNLTAKIVEELTGKKLDAYDSKIDVIKDCITGFMKYRRNIHSKELKYVNNESSVSAKKNIFSIIKKLPNIENANFDGELITASEINLNS